MKDIESKTLNELRKYCRDNKIKDYSSKKKLQLIQLINNFNKKENVIVENIIIGKDENKDVNKDDKDENKDDKNENKDDKDENKDDKNQIIIIKGDCIDKLKTMKDNSIDCVITDPPYFIDKLDNNWNSLKVINDTNSHIKHLPKGMKFKKEQVKKLYDFYLEISKILLKKMKPGACYGM